MPGIKGTSEVVCPKCGRKGTRRLEMVNCGKPSCTKCPHGPYYYVFHRVGDKVTKCYIGKTWPGVLGEAGNVERHVRGNVEMDPEKHPNYIICPKCGRPGTKRAVMIKCGKPNCNKCPHGPYWYVAHRTGKKMTQCYIGKTWPEAQQ